MKYCNVPTVTQDELKMERNFKSLLEKELKMEQNFKNLLEKIVFMQNYLFALPAKNNKVVTDKINEMNDEIKKDIGEQLGAKFEKNYDDIIGFTETVIQGNLDLKV